MSKGIVDSKVSQDNGKIFCRRGKLSGSILGCRRFFQVSPISIC